MALRRCAAEFGLRIDDEQLAQFRAYLTLLRQWKDRFNLTAIQDPEGILVKHFLDSLACARVPRLQQAKSLVDVGAGAGFPGLPLKIAFPRLTVLLIDSVQKRLRFVDQVIADLGLADTSTLHRRAEEAGRDPRHRERYEVATARAVAPLNVLVEWLLPLVAVGGAAIAMKGPEVSGEVEDALGAIQRLGGGEPQVEVLALPETDLRRSLIVIPKVAPTPPDLPRRTGIARKRPLSTLPG